MVKTPTNWTPETNQPTGFTPYGSSQPTVMTQNDGSAPTSWTDADTKNPTTFTGIGKTPSLFASTFGFNLLTYDTLGISYNDPLVIYDMLEENQPDPSPYATTWSPA